MESCRQLPLLSVRRSLACWGALLLVLPLVVARGQSTISTEEALRLVFPLPVQVERKTLFLNDEQLRAIRKLSRAPVDSKLITYYVGSDTGGVVGYAFIETHIVRTMPETFLVHLAPDATVRAVELLAFHEPQDYRPPERWLEQFDGRGLTDELWLKRGIQNIVGATITSQAIVSRIRRIVATYEIAVREGH